MNRNRLVALRADYQILLDIGTVKVNLETVLKHIDEILAVCERCDGAGTVLTNPFDDTSEETESCTDCGGTGTRLEERVG